MAQMFFRGNPISKPLLDFFGFGKSSLLPAAPENMLVYTDLEDAALAWN